MKRARLELTWDELHEMHMGLQSYRDYLARRLDDREVLPVSGPMRQIYERELAVIDALLPRVAKAMGRV